MQKTAQLNQGIIKQIAENSDEIQEVCFNMNFFLDSILHTFLLGSRKLEKVLA